MKKFQIVILIVIGWYLFLATLHYFGQRPLWLDEYCIFVNIHNQSLDKIFQQPLLIGQQFPRIYLYLIGLLSHQFNDQLLALRLLPFVCMISAFFAWIYLAQKQSKSEMGLLTYFMCWAASIPLIYYAAELKQYSMDVLVSSLFLLFLYHQKELYSKVPGWVYVVILTLLGLTGLFSYPAFFFMPLPLFNLFMSARAEKEQWKYFWFYLSVCILCSYCLYQLDLRQSNASNLIGYWRNYFISFESPIAFLRSFQEAINNFISRWFAEQPKWIRTEARFIVGLGLIRLIVGFWSDFKRDQFHFKSIGAIAGIVFIEHLLLSIFKKYPLGVPRMSLFFAPMLLWLTVDAVEWIKQRNKYCYMIVQYPFMVYLLYISLGIAQIIFQKDLGAQSPIWQ